MTNHEKHPAPGPFDDLIPWASDALWQEVNGCMAHTVGLHHHRLVRTRRLAREILADLRLTFPVMEDLCAHTCPACPEPCCGVAKLWFDFRDLIFLHLNGIRIPEAQPLDSYDATCRYLGSRGCVLPRPSRPWICTDYLCPRQTARLRRGGREALTALNRHLEKIKKKRRLLEEDYIGKICPAVW